MPDITVKKYQLRFFKKLRAVIIAGLVVTVPIGITIWILAWLFESIDKLLRPLTVYFFGHEVVGLGFAVIILLILLVGVIATNVIGKRLVRWGEGLLGKVPISRVLYVAIKQVLQSFAEPQKTGFMQVVMLQYPRKEMFAIGFITNIYTDENGKKLVNVFIPTSPNPTTGFLQIVDESQVIPTNMTVEEGLKMVVSAGRLSSDEVSQKMRRAKANAEKEPE